MHYAIMYEKAFIMIVQEYKWQEKINNLPCECNSFVAGWLFTKAIQALKQGNPFLYSPGFLDRENVWKLDKNIC